MKTKRHKLSRDPRTGIYYVKVQVHGTRRRFTFGKQRKLAESELRKLERDLADGGISFAEEPDVKLIEPCDPNEDDLRTLIDAHCDWVEQNRAHSTFIQRHTYLEEFARFVGDCKISEITRITLENYFSWAKVNHSKSQNGGNAYLRHVKTLFLWAEDMDVCACPVKKFPRMADVLPETKRFTDEELVTLLQRMTDLDFRDMIVFGLLTGLRPQELRGLQRENIMRDGQGELFVYIEKHKTARMTHEPKPRSVPLVPEAAEIYKRQVKAHPNTNYLFVNGDGNPYKPYSFRQRLRRWCKRAGIRPRPPYALRHTFGSLEAEANINQAVIGQVMGHTQLRTTTRYIANNYDHHKNAVRAIVDRIPHNS